MPTVVLLIPERGRLPSKEYECEVAPSLGDNIALQLDGKSIFFIVEDTWHTMTGGNKRLKYYAVLKRAEPPRKWTELADYAD